jgi:Cdc6-like AAA superfamily ATPase
MIRDASYLDREWVPEDLQHRNAEKNALRSALSPLVDDSSWSGPEQVLIKGRSNDIRQKRLERLDDSSEALSSHEVHDRYTAALADPRARMLLSGTHVSVNRTSKCGTR